MNSSGPRAAGDSDPDLARLLAWQHVDCELAVDIPIRVLRDIDEHCNGPNSTGVGILVGFVNADPSIDLVLQVEDVFPLDTDSYGQLALSALDRFIAGNSSPGNSASTIGLFVRDAAGEPDRIVKAATPFKVFFPATMVVLVVSGDGLTMVCRWSTKDTLAIALKPPLDLRISDPEKLGAAPFRPVTQVLENHKPASTISRIPQATLKQSTPVSDTNPVRAARSGTRRFEIRRRVWAGAVVIAGFALAAGLWYQRSSREPDPASPRVTASRSATARHLDLRVSRRGPDLLIQWDRDQTRILGARSGKLQIKDGSLTTSVELTERNLTSGQILYVSRSADVEIELTALTPSETLHESLRVIQAGETSPSHGPAPTSSERRTLQTMSASARDDVPAMTSNIVRQPTSPPMRQTFIPPAQEQQTQLTATAGSVRMELAPSPEVASNAASSQRPPALELPKLTVPPPIQSAPKLEPVAPEPTRTAPASELLKPGITPASSPRAPTFQLPVPTRQITPVLPPSIKTLIARETEVEVKLKVDVEGRVTAAQAVESSGVKSYLAKTAEATARLWRFRPAMRDGIAVPADFVVQFKFKP